MSGNEFYEKKSNYNTQCVGLKKIDSYFITVENITINGNRKILVSKIELNYTIIWSKYYNFDNSTENFAYNFIIDNKNNIVVVGAVSNKEPLIIKINSNNGDLIFSKKIITLSNQNSNNAYKIIQLKKDTTNDYIILGSLNYPYSHSLSRIGKSGIIKWSKLYDCNGGNELIYSLCESNEGDIITGGHYHNLYNFDKIVIKYNSINGNVKSTQYFDFKYNSLENGGFDDVVAIPNTELVVFATVINNSTTPSIHGVTVYNTKTEKIERIQFYSLGMLSRVINIEYSSKYNQIILGGMLRNSNLTNGFIQVINFNNLNSYTLKTPRFLNLNKNISAAPFLTFINNSDEILFGSHHIFDNNQNISNSTIGRVNYLDTTCMRNIESNLVTLNIPNSKTVNISVSNLTVENINYTSFNISSSFSQLCYSDCVPSSKKFNLFIKNKIDTACVNDNIFNVKIDITNNINDSAVKIIAFKKINNVFMALDSFKNKESITFNLARYQKNVNEFMFVGKVKCSFNDTVFFTVIDNKISANLNSIDSLFCFNEIVNLSISAIQVKPMPLNFNWIDLNSNLSISNTSYLSFAIEKNYKLKLEVKDNCSEDVIFYKNLYLSPNFTSNLIISPKLGCEPLEINLTYPLINSNSLNITNKWKLFSNTEFIDSIEFDNSNIPVNKMYLIQNAGDYQLRLEFYFGSRKQCYTFEDDIKILKKAKADFEIYPKNIEISDSVVHFVNTSQWANSYQWSFSNGNKSNEISPKYKFEAPGNYIIKLLAKNENDCNDSIEKMINIHDWYRMFIPSAFSPNKDGSNDLWQPFIGNYQNLEIMIFNRWGEMIYFSHENKGWDGKYRDEFVQDGVYLYIINIKDIKGKNYSYKGTLEMLR